MHLLDVARPGEHPRGVLVALALRLRDETAVGYTRYLLLAGERVGEVGLSVLYFLEKPQVVSRVNRLRLRDSAEQTCHSRVLLLLSFLGVDLEAHARLRLPLVRRIKAVSYTHLRAHETRHDLVCRLLLEKKKKKKYHKQ